MVARLTGSQKVRDSNSLVSTNHDLFVVAQQKGKQRFPFCYTPFFILSVLFRSNGIIDTLVIYRRFVCFVA